MSARTHYPHDLLRCLLTCAALLAGADGALADGIVRDAQGSPVRSASGGCVRSAAWRADQPVAGCDAMPDRIVLLPNPQGQAGAVIVHSASSSQILNQAYASLNVTANGQMQTGIEDATAVRARYADLLQAMPPRPQSFTVHFLAGSSTDLAPDSAAVVQALKLALRDWPAPQITVVGHTDRTGTPQANDALSVQRAQTVVELLLAQGVTARQIDAAGRGEREPVEPTAPGVASAANRRVEITLR